MGYRPILGLETGAGEDDPFWFTKTNKLAQYLVPLDWTEADNELVRLGAHFQLDLNPLSKIVFWEEEPLESFLARDPTEERRQIWYSDHAAREAAWQDPEVIITALRSLLAVLAESSTVFSELGIDDDYFTDGYFYQNITDILKEVERARDQGIRKVRIVEY